jgi:glycylpeptide N-tetradecanoyltransferase
LPEGFEWCNFDVTNDEEVNEICEFLMDHYVEDLVGNFRLHYSKEKFRWGAATPGYIKDWHFLVRNSKNKKILASIVGCPKKIVINGQTIKMCEVNFLAVHHSLRGKRMAQIVI